MQQRHFLTFTLFFFTFFFFFANAELEKRRHLIPKLQTIAERDVYKRQVKSAPNPLRNAAAVAGPPVVADIPSNSSTTSTSASESSTSSSVIEPTPTTTTSDTSLTTTQALTTDSPKTTAKATSTNSLTRPTTAAISTSTSYFTLPPTATLQQSTPTSQANNSGSSGTKIGTNFIIVIAVVGGVIVLAFLIFQVYRKWRLAPSSRFEEKLQPIDFTPRHHESDVFFRQLNEP